MSKLRAAGVPLLVAMLLLVSFPHGVTGASFPPERFFGALYDVNNIAVSAGTEASVWSVAGVRYAYTYTGSIPGQQPNEYRIDVPAYDPATGKGAQAGETLVFKVAGITANETANFATGITVNPGPASQLVVSGITDLAMAGTASAVTVTAKDAYGNIATNYTGTIHFTSSDAQATLPADYAFEAADNGVKTFSGGVTLKTASSLYGYATTEDCQQSVTATDTVTSSITGQQTITVSQVPVHHKKTSWGEIVGGIVGGLGIISALVYYLLRRKRRSALLRRRRRPTVWLYHLLD